MRCMDVLRLADPFEEIPSFVRLLFPCFRKWGHKGALSLSVVCGTEEQRARQTERKKKSCIDHFTSTISPGVHYPYDITHAQTALFRVLLLIELLNDVESSKTNSVFRVWWLNDMDFHPCGLSWGRRPLSIPVCVRGVQDDFWKSTHVRLIIHPHISDLIPVFIRLFW